jgi:hypothetical protein
LETIFGRVKITTDWMFQKSERGQWGKFRKSKGATFVFVGCPRFGRMNMKANFVQSKYVRGYTVVVLQTHLRAVLETHTRITDSGSLYRFLPGDESQNLRFSSDPCSQ